MSVGTTGEQCLSALCVCVGVGIHFPKAACVHTTQSTVHPTYPRTHTHPHPPTHRKRRQQPSTAVLWRMPRPVPCHAPAVTTYPQNSRKLPRSMCVLPEEGGLSMSVPGGQWAVCATTNIAHHMCVCACVRACGQAGGVGRQAGPHPSHPARRRFCDVGRRAQPHRLLRINSSTPMCAW